MLVLISAIAAAAPHGGCPSRLDALTDDARARGRGVLLVDKSERWIGVYTDGALLQCSTVGLGGGGDAGPKERQGDMRTPEGWYRTSDKPWSQFYKAIAVHYPDAGDAERALASESITRAQAQAIRIADAKGAVTPIDTALGGDILIHGGGGTSDWTLGCVALDDGDIDTLRTHLPAGMRTWVWLRD